MDGDFKTKMKQQHGEEVYDSDSWVFKLRIFFLHV